MIDCKLMCWVLDDNFVYIWVEVLEDGMMCCVVGVVFEFRCVKGICEVMIEEKYEK